MLDRLIVDVATMFARVHAWRVPGEWVLAAFAVGALVAGYLVPGAERARQGLREFSSWRAWRAQERKRIEVEQAKALEFEEVMTLLTPRKQPSVAAARQQSKQAVQSQKEFELDASDVVFMEPAGDDDKTRAWTPKQALARESQVRLAVTRAASSGGGVRLPRAEDLAAGRSFVARRRGLA